MSSGIAKSEVKLKKNTTKVPRVSKKLLLKRKSQPTAEEKSVFQNGKQMNYSFSINWTALENKTAKQYQSRHFKAWMLDREPTDEVRTDRFKSRPQ